MPEQRPSMAFEPTHYPDLPYVEARAAAAAVTRAGGLGRAGSADAAGAVVWGGVTRAVLAGLTSAAGAGVEATAAEMAGSAGFCGSGAAG